MKFTNNSKKLVYVSAIAGVLLTGAQAGQFASTYTAHADAVSQNSNIATLFTDQFGNTIPGSAYSITPGLTAQKSDDIAASLKADGVDVSKMPATFDLTKQVTYVLPQPTHLLTINAVDQSGHVVSYVKTTVTNYGQTSTDQLVSGLNAHNYSYSAIPSAVDNSQTDVNFNVTAPTTTTTTTTTTSTTNESSQSTSTSTSESAKTTETSSSASTSSEAAQSSEASSSASTSSEATKTTEASSSASTSTSEVAKSTETSSSAAASTESSAQSSASSEASKSAEPSKTIVIKDPVNKGEDKKAVAKHAKETPASDKKEETKKLPQTGDNTNAARNTVLGMVSIVLGSVLAFFGLRRKNK
ncbi:hypothetical protein AKUA2003_01340 [Apilactobacillus kunkeei]|nr:hypothetical protein AKUA2003_01340 [Apilactobacillus kunkeei]CAI2557315.1 hypothetical protein AKUA1001_01350 [Apilactobacillus kunkeei]CAI2801114.1 hypothetical protein AKUA2002_01340 [Apilactobacillus kunkeei]